MDDEECVLQAVALQDDCLEIDPQRVTALAHKITAYDSAYLALAEQEKCDLWTGDVAFYRAVCKKLRWVRWIGDYSLQ
ncbi:MAG: type II toxin-antitoxin system VapC family toxin [Candidatus Bipolaricaulota bacterium]|nr:type II toxin-antitoxin system VapC family toxin [Candidatus Bipolaricaulota bacterium]MDW8031407.1 type II toxin-antitoxin system VapC family toxin [Candidatus Bipolaricaulota bacterium]